MVLQAMESNTSPYFGNSAGELTGLRKRPGETVALTYKLRDAKKRELEDKERNSAAYRFDRSFFGFECIDLAKRLLGTCLTRKFDDGTIIRGMIVETEAYPGGEDVASHSFNGRRTARNEAEYMGQGTAYVYFTYGMYYCLNIVAKEPGSAVLIRAIEPLEGHERMQVNRLNKRKAESATPLKTYHLCNGPAKLCIAYEIDRASFDQKSLFDNEYLWVEEGRQVLKDQIITSTRIGIGGASQSSALKPYRFYLRDNRNVSVRDKKKESEM